MIEKLMDIPDIYKVRGKMNKDLFISNANISSNGSSVLSKNLMSVEVIYSIRFQDGEFLIIEIELNGDLPLAIKNKVAKYVASSIAYPCMVYLNCGRVGRLYWFERANGKFNPNHSIIQEVYSIYINTIENKNLSYVKMKKMFADLRNILIENNTMRMLVEGWRRVIYLNMFEILDDEEDDDEVSYILANYRNISDEEWNSLYREHYKDRDDFYDMEFDQEKRNDWY